VLLGRLTANVSRLDESVKLLDTLLEDEDTTAAKARGNIAKALVELRKQCEDAREKYELASGDFRDLCMFFGEACPPADPESFFGEIAALSRSLQAAAFAGSKTRRKALPQNT
jgi:hypothetical protein